MAKVRRDKLSIYIPQEKLKEKPIERLQKLARERDRSVSHLVVKAILEFLEREKKVTGPHKPDEPPNNDDG